MSIPKLLVLAVIALVVFGPHELPKIASQAGRALRDLRRIGEGAEGGLREGLGAEFDFQDLNPRRFVQKHLIDDLADPTRPLYDEFKGTSEAVLGGAAAGTAVATGARGTLVDGEEPPFDLEAT